MSLSEAYAFAFYKIRGWAKAFADDNLHDWKAILALGVLQGFVVYGTISFIEGTIGITVLPKVRGLLALPLAITIFGFNYYLLMHREIWRKYERTFRSYSPLKNRILVVALLLVIVATLVFGFTMTSFGVV